VLLLEREDECSWCGLSTIGKSTSRSKASMERSAVCLFLGVAADLFAPLFRNYCSHPIFIPLVGLQAHEHSGRDDKS
jgi:hypothetical protein